MPRQSRIPLAAKMVRRAENWRWVNRPLDENELAAIKISVEHGRPLGEPACVQRTVARLNFGHTLWREGWFTHEKV